MIKYRNFYFAAIDVYKRQEIEQALNIKRVIDSRPNEKFLIHCGFDHALEGIHNSWEKAMAGRLTEYTGIDLSLIHI